MATDDQNQSIDTIAPVAPKLVTSSEFNFLDDPRITMQTNMGTVVFELHPEQAPITVANMLAYVDAGFYDEVLFHRVIAGFMVQGGMFDSSGYYKPPTYGPIALESDNGLSNLRGTIAMARTSIPDSATAQFFVNQVDNTALDYSSEVLPGYAVFGEVVSGMSVIDNIAQVPTATIGSFENVPVTPVVAISIEQSWAGRSVTNTGELQVIGLETGAEWSFSLDGGSSWSIGNGSSLVVPEGDYAANDIQVRQTDAAGNTSVLSGKLTSALEVDTVAPTVSDFTPTAADTDVAVGSHIVVTFSEEVQRGTGNIVLKTAAGTTVATYDSDTSNNLLFNGETLIIDPTIDLDYGTQYKVEFAASAVKDLAGNSYAGTTSFDFTTITVRAEIQAKVLQIYSGVWETVPDAQGLDYWTSEIDSDHFTYVDVATSFFDQPLVKEKYSNSEGNLFEGEDMLAALYRNLFKIETPDAEGFNYWKQEVGLGPGGGGDPTLLTSNIGTLILQFIDGMWANPLAAETQVLYTKFVNAGHAFYDAQIAEGVIFSELFPAAQQDFLDAARYLTAQLTSDFTEAELYTLVDEAMDAFMPGAQTATISRALLGIEETFDDLFAADTSTANQLTTTETPIDNHTEDNDVALMGVADFSVEMFM